MKTQWNWTFGTKAVTSAFHKQSDLAFVILPMLFSLFFAVVYYFNVIVASDLYLTHSAGAAVKAFTQAALGELRARFPFTFAG